MSRTQRLDVAAGLACILVTLGVLGCASRPGPRPTAAAETAALAERTFSAVLFPYIPDSGGDSFASLIATLESWFEAANPEIDLEITIDPNMDLYSFSTLATLLGTGAGSVNMVEIDTLLLGDLVAQSIVQPLPFPVDGLGLLPTALAAAEVDSTSYGVPTYLCGNYIYSWDAGIGGVDSGQGLIDFLTQHPDPGATPLIGNFEGSWTLPSLYVDAWADSHTNDPTQVATAYDLPLDQPTMDIFSLVVDLCGVNGGPCLDGTYADNTVAETLFAQNQANGFVGFSERLFYILQARGGDVNLPFVISAPLGVGSNPVMFVDALVLNPVCTGQCATDAETFSNFMSSLQVRVLIAFSDDVSPKTFPRYLLQALASFYTTAPGSQNLVYQQLAPFVLASQAFPNQGFPEARLQLNPALEGALGAGEARAVASSGGESGVGVELLHAPARDSRAAIR